MGQKTNNSNKDPEAILQEVKYIPNGAGDVLQYKPRTANKPDTLFLYFTMYIGFLPLVVGGTELVWLSSAYPSLVSNNSEINPLDRPATTAQISMIGGVPVLIGLIGCLVMPKFADNIGRKLFLQIIAVVMFLSNIFQGLSTSVIHLFICRSFINSAFAAYVVIMQVYISEICEDHNRAKYLCIMGLCLPLGQIYSFLIGPILSYRVFTQILGLPIVPYLVFFFFAPETPVYLLIKGRKEECTRVLSKLRNNKSTKELSADLDKINETLQSTDSTSGKNIWDLFRTKEAKVGICLALLLAFSTQITGVAAIMQFLGPLLLAAGTTLPENIMTVTVAAVQVMGSLIAAIIVEKVGRKTLLSWSSLVYAISLTTCGLFYYLQYNNSFLVSYLLWLPLTSIITSLFVFSVGLSPVTLALVCELFLSDLKAAAVSLTIGFMTIVVFATASAYPFIVEVFGIHWCIWMFAGFSFISTILIYKLIPETRGKSLLEIQGILKKY